MHYRTYTLAYEALIYVAGVNVDVNTAHKGGYKSKNNQIIFFQ